MQKALLERVAAMQLPPNFLDELVDRLGGPSRVAEMTGRRGRIVRDPGGRGVFQLRARPDSSEMDSLNVTETGAARWAPLPLPACASAWPVRG
jgi:C-terminal domain on Strawberry notch homologue